MENREKPNPVAKDGVDGVPKASVDNVVLKEGLEDGVPEGWRMGFRGRSGFLTQCIPKADNQGTNHYRDG